MDKTREIQLIYEGVHACTLCHSNPEGTIKPDTQKVVRMFFKEILDSNIFIIAQSLAETQVRLSGIPFHNSQVILSNGGRFLEKYLNQVGYTIVPGNGELVLVYSTDMVQCFPGKKKVGTGDNIPIWSEIINCMTWLDKELSIMKPKVVLLFGTPATKSFYRYYLDEPFTKLSDHYFAPRDFRDGKAICLPHPTSMVRDKSKIYDKTFDMIRNLIE
jgi:uracil-DNA glycosylase family 4